MSAMAALRFALLCAALCAIPPAAAQPYPTKPIRIIVPFSAGGFTDVVGRIVAQKLSEVMGQQVIIDNRPGAGSTIGTDLVAKARPDGYTLVMISTTHVISPWLYKTLPYDPFKDFEPVMRLVDGPYVMVTHPSLGVRSVAELTALAKAEPGRIDYVSSGNGSAQHLVGALYSLMSGAPINHVPYKGSGQAMQDLAGGQVKLGFVGVPNALPHIQSGRLRALAVTTRKRAPELPDVPTLDEAGVKGFEATVWLALLAPAGTSREITNRLRAEIVKILADADAQKTIASAGVVVNPSSPEELNALMRTELDKWGKVVKETGATVN